MKSTKEELLKQLHAAKNKIFDLQDVNATLYYYKTEVEKIKSTNFKALQELEENKSVISKLKSNEIEIKSELNEKHELTSQLKKNLEELKEQHNQTVNENAKQEKAIKSADKKVFELNKLLIICNSDKEVAFAEANQFKTENAQIAIGLNFRRKNFLIKSASYILFLDFRFGSNKKSQ